MPAPRVLWNVEHLNLSVGRQVLFHDAAMSVADRERVALVGRNGCGKSTLLRIVQGLEQPSSGDITVARNIRILSMPQDLEAVSEGTVASVISEGMSYFEELLHQYDTMSMNNPEHEQLERFLTLHDAWNLQNKLDTLIGKLGLPDGNRPVAELSGGERRRVLLARAIIGDPDLLLLDEPTNHLDIESVAKIEEFLQSYTGACLFVTHDRYFLDRVATRILELDNGSFFSCEGTYADFLEAKANREYIEDVEAEKRAKFLRLEVEWVRRSPKARLRRNLGRMNRYYELAAIEGPKRTANIDLVIPAPPRLGNKVVDLKNISYSVDGKQLFHDFSFEFKENQKVGIVGPNGCGKSTFLKLITGDLNPGSGSIAIADTVIFNYIDQARETLNEENRVWEEIAGNSDFVNLGTDRVTVRSYLKRFLFEDERINSRIKYLSGGEKARLLLAKVLKRGGNFLILDEPTNDLDLPTLRILEEALASFPSTVLVVSHDRYFLNRVCNHIIAFEHGELLQANGDYDYYLQKHAEHEAELAEKNAQSAQSAKKKTLPAAPPAPKNKKALSWKEEQELAGMEVRIEEIENKVSELEAVFSDPDFFAKRGAESPKLQAELADAQALRDSLYARWEELEQKKNSTSG